LASRGLRDLDGGPEEVTDQMERDALERQARSIKKRAMIVAAALTVVAVAI